MRVLRSLRCPIPALLAGLLLCAASAACGEPATSEPATSEPASPAVTEAQIEQIDAAADAAVEEITPENADAQLRQIEAELKSEGG